MFVPRFERGTFPNTKYEFKPLDCKFTVMVMIFVMMMKMIMIMMMIIITIIIII